MHNRDTVAPLLLSSWCVISFYAKHSLNSIDLSCFNKKFSAAQWQWLGLPSHAQGLRFEPIEGF